MRRRSTLPVVLTGAVVAMVLAVAGSASAGAPASGRHSFGPEVVVSCGETLTANTTLPGDLDCSGYAGTALMLDAGVTLNLGHHTLTVQSGQDGVYSEANGATVTAGTISGGNHQVYFDGASHDTASSLTLSLGQVGVYLEHTTAEKVETNTITNSVVYGVSTLESAGDLVSGNTISLCATGIFIDGDAHDQISSNKVTGCATNFYDYFSDLDTYSSNTSTGGTYGFYLYDDKDGAVIVKSNTESGAVDDGFYTLDAYNPDADAAPYTLITGNKASNNGGDGFDDQGSVDSTWTSNTATGNTGYGFLLDSPTRYTVTGNSATSNIDGFYLEHNYDPDNVLKFSSNRATSNTDYGFIADDGAPGTGNVGTKDGAADCYLVICGAGVTSTP